MASQPDTSQVSARPRMFPFKIALLLGPWLHAFPAWTEALHSGSCSTTMLAHDQTKHALDCTGPHVHAADRTAHFRLFSPRTGKASAAA